MKGLKKGLNSDKLFIIVNYIFAILILFICLYPLYFILIASISDIRAVNSGEVLLLPKGITFAGYKLMLEKKEIWIGYANSIFYTVVGTIIRLAVTISLAYTLSRRTLPFRKQLNLFFIIPMFIGGGLIPSYLLINSLELVDTYTFMVIRGCVSVGDMIICRTFFEETIPLEVIEAAKIDGSGEMRLYTRIVLPLSKSILAVMTLYFAVAHWNDYYAALIYLRDSNKYPLQLVLRNLLNSTKLTSVADEITQATLDLQSMKYGVIMVASVPVLALYPFVQKHFVKGVMIGAIKG